MPRERLTEEGVAKLKPPPQGRQVDYFDTHMPGLVLRVNHGGAKIWRALYYVKRTGKDGKPVSIPTTFKLGRYPALKLKEAREKAGQFLANPQKAKAKAEAATGSFKQVAENFLVRHVKKQKLRTQDEIERILRTLVYPRWQDRRFEENPAARRRRPARHHRGGEWRADGRLRVGHRQQNDELARHPR